MEIREQRVFIIFKPLRHGRAQAGAQDQHPLLVPGEHKFDFRLGQQGYIVMIVAKCRGAGVLLLWRRSAPVSSNGQCSLFDQFRNGARMRNHDGV
jgi:hypothetical protein